MSRTGMLTLRHTVDQELGYDWLHRQRKAMTAVILKSVSRHSNKKLLAYCVDCGRQVNMNKNCSDLFGVNDQSLACW